MKKRTLFTVSVLLALRCLGTWCVPVAAQELLGQGEWQSISGEAMRGTWTAELSQSGIIVRGSLKLTGSTVFSGGSVSGTIDGQQVVLGVMSEGVTEATFSGKIDGQLISGEWKCPVIKDEGVWFGTLKSGASSS